jgi:hypothetical protein
VPYALTTQSVLSEDYFEVVNHSIDTSKGDKVFAYTRADRQAEAMVLQDGVVTQIFPYHPAGVGDRAFQRDR